MQRAARLRKQTTKTISVDRRTVSAAFRRCRADFFRQFSVFLRPDSIGRCPDHGSCAQYSIFRRVHPTDFDRLTARLPGRPRNELARRLGYTPLASLVISAGTVFAAIDCGVSRTLQTLNPASGITFVFLIFVVFRCSFVAEK